MMNNMEKSINIFIIKLLSIVAFNLFFCKFAEAQTPDSIYNRQSVIGIAYGLQPEWKVNSSISSVKGSDLNKSFTSNIANTLYGRISGLTVQQGSAEPGLDSPTMNIRGLNTFGSGSGIFVVIDGFPSSLTIFQELTPNEIESVSVLKDASAIAIYGNRGANGVLLVTTKKGSESKLKVNFNAQYGFQEAARLPKFLNSYDYANLYNEALLNDGSPVKYSQNDLNAYKNRTDPMLYPDVNWYNILLRPAGPIQNYNLNASGGTDAIKYFILFNLIDNKGLLRPIEKITQYGKNSSYTRYNFRTNFDVSFSNWLSASATLGGSVEDKTTPGVNESLSSVFDMMASIAPNLFPVWVGNNEPGGSALYRNPLAEIIDRGYISSDTRSAEVSLNLKANLSSLTPGLSLSGSIGFNSYSKSYSNKTRDYQRYSVSENSDGSLIYTSYGQNTSLTGDESSNYQWRNYSLQAFLNYNRIFGLHAIDAMVMSDYDEITQSDVNLPYKNAGLGGRFTYTFDNKYIGEFSFGYSGNDNFPRGKRFGFFPAGSVGWIVSNERFLKNNQILNFLKLRASYGLTGNSDIGGARYMYNQYYQWGGYYYFGSTNSQSDIYQQGPLANKNVTWEKETKLNLGLDATLLKNIGIKFDYFNNHRRDILAKPYATVPDYLGFSLPDMNIGKTDNKGFEASIRYDRNNSEGLTYFAEASVWYAKNKIVYNAEIPQLYDYQYSKGHIIGQPFVLQAIGFYQTSDFNSDGTLKSGLPVPSFDKVRPGDIKYKDQNGDKVIDSNDFVPMGYTAMPETTLGLHVGGTYKGFDLDVLFQSSLNRTVYLDGKYYQAFQNDGKISTVALNRWTETTASTATYPRLSASNNMNNYQYSSFWQRNGDFLKLRSLEIGYSIPRKVLEKITADKARVFLNGTNLFSLDHMNGFTDPETLSGYPSVRTFSLGLNLQF